MATYRTTATTAQTVTMERHDPREHQQRGDRQQLYKSRPARRRTLIHAIMTCPGMPGEDVIVRNVSQRGMCIASRAMPPESGETISLALAGLAGIEGEVRWVGQGEFGIELVKDLDLNRLGLANQRRHAGIFGNVGSEVEARLCQASHDDHRALRGCC